MTLVVLGIDALDPDLVDPSMHPNLALEEMKTIETIVSDTGEPSTHELWPTIITGLSPQEHGLVLGDDGVAWGNPVLNVGSSLADYVLPRALQSRLGAWLLTNTELAAFRTPATYYAENDLETIFDDRRSKAIGIPNFVVETDVEDREHELRKSLGELFQRDPEATGGHRSTDPESFYNNCLEMATVRVARVRAALRSRAHELVFGYTSAIDLVGHISNKTPGMQDAVYEAVDTFAGELRKDLDTGDELLILSDHGLQDGLHTDEAMVSATETDLLSGVEAVTDIKYAVDRELDRGDHLPTGQDFDVHAAADADMVQEQLEDLGYIE